MLGEYWIDKQKNGNRNSFFLMLDGLELNADEKEIFHFMKEAQFRYENIMLPPKPRLDVCSLEPYFKKSSEPVLEALMKCCILTGIFVPIYEITKGKYKSSLSYSQRYAMWKGSGFKGRRSFGLAFINEALYKTAPFVDNLFALHTQMERKDFSVEQAYLTSVIEVSKNPQKTSLWTSKDKKAIAFRETVFECYPDLKTKLEQLPKMVCHAKTAIPLYNSRQKTL